MKSRLFRVSMLVTILVLVLASTASAAPKPPASLAVGGWNCEVVEDPFTETMTVSNVTALNITWPRRTGAATLQLGYRICQAVGHPITDADCQWSVAGGPNPVAVPVTPKMTSYPSLSDPASLLFMVPPDGTTCSFQMGVELADPNGVSLQRVLTTSPTWLCPS